MAEIGIPYLLETPRGDLFFNGFDQDPANGYLAPYFRLTDVEGLDGPAIRTPNEPRPQRGGLIAFPFLEGGMFPALKGRIVPRDLHERRHMEDQLRGHFRSMLNVDGLLKWRPTGTHVVWNTTLTITNAITDAMRASGNEGDGGPFNDNTHGLWEGTTNLISNDGFEVNTTGWVPFGSTVTRITTEDKFQAACGEVDTNNGIANEGIRHDFTASGTQRHTISAWVRQEGGTGGTVRLRIADTGGGTIIAGAPVALTATWQRITLTTTGNLTNATTYRLIVETDVQQNIIFHVDGVQAENKLVATPYRQSGNGARPAVTAVGESGPTGGPGQQAESATYGPLQPDRGWLHFVLRPGWAYDAAPYGNGRVTLWQWRADSTHYIEIYYDPLTGKFKVARRNGGSTDTAETAVVSFAKGATISVTAAWTSADLRIAFNGTPGAAVASTSSAVFLGGVDWTLGYGSGANDYLDGDVHYFVGGLGTLRDADFAALHAQGASGDSAGLVHFRPGASVFSDTGSQASILWAAETSSYFVQQERRLGVRAFESPQITSDGIHKDFRLGMIAADPVVQSEIEYTLTDSASPWLVTLTNSIDGDFTGLAEVYPVVRITAGVTTLNNVDIQNDDAGKKVRLLALGVAAGTWVEIDFLRETLTTSNGFDVSGKIDIANTEFWWVDPGSSDDISLQNISGSVAELQVRWRLRFAA